MNSVTDKRLDQKGFNVKISYDLMPVILKSGPRKLAVCKAAMLSVAGLPSVEHTRGIGVYVCLC